MTPITLDGLVVTGAFVALFISLTNPVVSRFRPGDPSDLSLAGIAYGLAVWGVLVGAAGWFLRFYASLGLTNRVAVGLVMVVAAVLSVVYGPTTNPD